MCSRCSAWLRLHQHFDGGPRLRDLLHLAGGFVPAHYQVSTALFLFVVCHRSRRHATYVSTDYQLDACALRIQKWILQILQIKFNARICVGGVMQHVHTQFESLQQP